MPLQLLSGEAHYTGNTFGQDASNFGRTPWDIRPWQSNSMFLNLRDTLPVVYYQIRIIYYAPSIHNIHQNKMQ
jgi:hypothetical protein